MGTKIILHGSGEHARVVLDCLLSSNFNVVALFDPKYSGQLMGVEQRGEYDPSFEPDAEAIVAIGDNATRKRAVQKTMHRMTRAIHSSVILSNSATVAPGSMLLQGVVVQARTRIGSHVILNTGCLVDHDCCIEDYVHIAPGAVLCGTVEVCEGALVGAGAVIIPGRKIGKWATIGAGAVVIDNIPDYAVAVGNPARVIRFDKQDE